MSDLATWRQRLGCLCSTTAIAAVLLATPAWAQTSAEAGVQSDEIVVTAQRREEASRDVPITVSTLSSDLLESANVQSLADTARVTTSLRFDAAGSFVQPTIRGVGTAITTSGGGPNVGIYVDGFFQSNAEVSDFQLMRVQNIQVLKGPQGTLFGRNTTGGAILVTTQDPSSDPEAEVSLSYGSFNTARAQGYATYGLADSIAMDIEGMYRHGDGFRENIFNGDDNVDEFEHWAARTGLSIELSPTVTALFRYTHSESDDPSALMTNGYVDESGDAGFLSAISQAGRDFYQTNYGLSNSTGTPLIYLGANFVPGSVTTDPDEVSLSSRTRFTNRSDAFQATFRADLGWADLTSYTQFREDDSLNAEDLDSTGLDIFLISIGVRNKTVSQEFLLNSNSDGRLQWTAGVNYYQNEDLWDIGASFGAPGFLPFGGSGTLTTSFAVFGDLTYEFIDNWFLTVGARYSDDEVSDAFFNTNFTTTAYIGADGNPVPVDPLVTPPQSRIDVPDLSNSDVTPRVVLRWKPNEESSVYVSYTGGYKAGILNVGGYSLQPIEPEEIEAFELGYKYDDRRLMLDVAGFFYDYQNLQVSSFQNAAAQIRNAASSEVYGIEAQGRFRVTDDFNIYGGVAWTHARYEEFPNAPFYTYCDPTVVSPPPPAAPDPLVCPAPPPNGTGPGSITQITTDASGFHMQRSPDYTANLGASYDIHDVVGGLVTLSGNLYYTSEFYFDPSEQFKQDSYTTLSLRAQWADPSDRYTVAVFGDNVTDERYMSQVLFNTLGIGSVWAQPATWGVSVGARF